ncbi:MAG TPA: ABC transporter ATP-binding protein [Chloroflexota bacterium]
MPLDLLRTYLRPRWREASLLAALLFGGVGLQLLGPQVLRAFVDRAQAGEAVEALAATAALFLGLTIATQAVTVAESYLAENLGWTTTNALRADLVRHCLALDLGFHAARTPGELIERIDGDVTAIANFFSRFVLRVLANALLLLGVLALLLREDLWIGLALAAFAALAGLVISRRGRFVTPRWTAARQSSADLIGFLEERLAGLVDLKANGATGYVMRRLHQRQRERFLTARGAMVVGSAFYAAVTLVFTAGYAVALGLGAWRYAAGAMTLGAVYLVFQYTQMLRQPLEQINRQIQDLQRAAASVARVRELLGTPLAVPDGPGAPLPPGPLGVELDGVSFAYGEGPAVLRAVRLRVEPGQVLGLVGRTGAGKSTVARLVARLYDPTAGAVRLGGVDLRSLRLDQLRARVGLVTQDVQLFQGSVRDNLTLFDRTVSEARLTELLEQIGLGDWLAALPGGLEAELGAGGAGLSAGQAQLLALGRLLLRDPGLIVLDEASSRLDPASERLVERALARLLEGRSAIVIAHRLSTLDRADAVALLEDGRVVEQGPRAALAADRGSRFAALLRAGGLPEALA